jgi:hypothetical protein
MLAYCTFSERVTLQRPLSWTAESRGPGIERRPFVLNFSEQERDGRAAARR